MAARIFTPGSLQEAVEAVVRRGAAPLAGATWIMRAPVRGEDFAASYVALRDLADLDAVEVGENTIAIGACVTHAALAAALQGAPGCAGLVQAAAQAANPAIRRVATVGGN